ncbi:hypothetical protein G6N74_03770 [Mesorhizobium sp. CGMCC 1.15528]|uniref:Uncharacterized protein n=1 Tax=Mesorhizobium zhangyense TaxID=1776730 RepID=A0A7C9VA60_9HYPH|nr:hypothetical protein [Mesorhizobium zhangyense]NGN40172.1 hypothetical protein [Mesorhizobium zhangyense]
MDENQEPARCMVELPTKTREFLSELSPDDIATIKTGLPIIRMIVGFGKVTKWLAITTIGIAVGAVHVLGIGDENPGLVSSATCLNAVSDCKSELARLFKNYH